MQANPESRSYVSPRMLGRYPALAALEDAPLIPATPKRRKPVAEMAQEFGEMAIQELAALAVAATEQTRLLACRELLDRAYGKPVQAVASAFDGKLTISWMQPGDSARVVEHDAT